MVYKRLAGIVLFIRSYAYNDFLALFWIKCWPKITVWEISTPYLPRAAGMPSHLAIFFIFVSLYCLLWKTLVPPSGNVLTRSLSSVLKLVAGNSILGSWAVFDCVTVWIFCALIWLRTFSFCQVTTFIAADPLSDLTADASKCIFTMLQYLIENFINNWPWETK